MSKEININRLNYESFVIDYLEGKLDAVTTAHFTLFLGNNPDIKEEISDLDNSVIIPKHEIFNRKANLKKEPVFLISGIGEHNYEELFIAHNEGDLTVEKEIALKEFLNKNPNLEDEFQLHGKLQIKPNSDIFKNKKSLKHNPYFGIIRYASIAATILVFLASWFFLGNQNNNRNKFASISELDSHNYKIKLSSNTVFEINTSNRQIISVNYEKDTLKSNNNELVVAQKTMIISTLNRKKIIEQLTDSYIFTRPVEQSKNAILSSSEILNTDLAVVEIDDNEKRKGLIARVFNNQVSKITQSIKTRRAKKAELKDPTYIKVIDGSLLVFNTITGTKTATVKTYNYEGELIGYQIEGRDILRKRNLLGVTEN